MLFFPVSAPDFVKLTFSAIDVQMSLGFEHGAPEFLFFQVFLSGWKAKVFPELIERICFSLLDRFQGFFEFLVNLCSALLKALV